MMAGLSLSAPTCVTLWSRGGHHHQSPIIILSPTCVTLWSRGGHPHHQSDLRDLVVARRYHPSIHPSIHPSTPFSHPPRLVWPCGRAAGSVLANCLIGTERRCYPAVRNRHEDCNQYFMIVVALCQNRHCHREYGRNGLSVIHQMPAPISFKGSQTQQLLLAPPVPLPLVQQPPRLWRWPIQYA